MDTKETGMEKTTEWGKIGMAEDDLAERFRQDLSDIGRDLEYFQGRMEYALERLNPYWNLPYAKMLLAPLDIEENKDYYLVRMNLPGVTKDRVGIKFLDQTLEIDVEKKMVRETEKKSYYLRERNETEYHRRLNFPAMIAPEKTEAKLEHGMLLVTVPKIKPAKELRVPLA